MPCKRKVLIIAYYFPPVGGGGVQRTAKFVKYLTHFGWEPIVLTVKTEVFKRTRRTIDNSLLDDIPSEIAIARTRSHDLANVSRSFRSHGRKKKKGSSPKEFLNKIGQLMVNPDAQMLWIPIAVATGLKLIRKHKIDLIYSTGNPWSDHIAGLCLKHLTGIPLIVDYRDPWNLSPFYSYSSKFRRKIQWFLESRVIGNASGAIFTTDIMRRDYTRAFGRGGFLTIRNGFDESDFSGVKRKKFDKFTIVYSGNMQPYRGPFYFLKALSNWLEKNPKARGKIQVIVLGRENAEARDLLSSLNLGGIVKLVGYVSHQESISHVLGADAVLSVVEFGGESIIPGKIYEYLASGKPILALVPLSGSAAGVLKKEKRDEFMVNPRDIIGVENKLNSLYRYFVTHKMPLYPTDNLCQYTRKHTAKELSEIFDCIAYQ